MRSFANRLGLAALLTGDPVALGRLSGRDRIIETKQQLRGVPERVQRPDLDQRFEDLAVRQPQIDTGAEVGQRTELAPLLARGDDRFDRALPHVLDREQAEADRVTLDGELQMAGVDIRRPDFDAHPAALGHCGRQHGGDSRVHCITAAVVQAHPRFCSEIAARGNSPSHTANRSPGVTPSPGVARG